MNIFVTQLLLSVVAFYAVLYYSGKRLDRRINAIYEELLAFSNERIAMRDATRQARALVLDTKEQVQRAIVRAFSSEQMMDWLKNAKVAASAPDFTTLIQLTYPALKDLKPGHAEWHREDDYED